MPAKNPEGILLMMQDDPVDETQTRRGTAAKAFRQPFWLTKTALSLFSLVFIACSITLIVLDRVITSRNGLPLTISTSSYSWTYGPTAILIVVLSLWRRVDYYFKAIQPWRELQTGPSLATKSILLDYITPFQVVSMTKALKCRHYAVASTIASFFLLKVVILISTTLFVVRETSIHGAFNITYQDSFNATGLWMLYHRRVNSKLHAPRPYLSPAFAGGSAAPIWTYLSILNNVPSNETKWKPPNDQVTQRFAIVPAGANVAELHAPVDIFIPRITCEDATLSAPKSGGSDDGLQYREYKFISESCNNSGVVVSACEQPKYADPSLPPEVSERICQPDPVVYTVHRVNCSGTNNAFDHTKDDWRADIEPYDIRYAITTAKFNVTMPHTRILDAVDLDKSGCIICKVGYGIESSIATLDVITGLVTLSPVEKQMIMLHNLSNNAFAEMLWNNLEMPADFLVVNDKVPTLKPGSGHIPGAEAVLFQLMNAQLGRPTDLEPLFQTSILKNATISVLEGVAQEFARQSLLSPKTLKVVAQGMEMENRLHMRHLAVWIMAAGFCALAIVCLLLLSTTQSVAWIPALSGSITSHAAILANSPDAQAAMTGTGHLTECGLKERLASLQFSAVTDQTGRLQLNTETACPSFSSTTFSPKIKPKKHRWLPLAARLPVIAITFTAPLICIGILELLYPILRDQKHLLIVGTKDSTALSYVIRLASTLVVFGMATMINNLDFTIVTFAPYSKLRSGSAPAACGILFHLLSVNPFLVLFKTIRHAQLGAAASNTATLIAGFLTIIVSGLWIPMDSRVINQPSAASVNSWDLAWLTHFTGDGDAAVALNLIRHGAAVTPATIWKDLVVPRISLPAASTDGAYRKANYSFDALALQPILNCTLLPQEDISTPIWPPPSEGGMSGQLDPESDTMILVKPTGIEPECSLSSNGSFANFEFNVTYEAGQNIWVGQYFDLFNATAGQVNNDCPSIGMFFGRLSTNQATGRNLTGLICSQGINQVPVAIKYKGDPALGEIDTLQVRGQPRALKNGTEGPQALGYGLGGFISSNLLNFARNDGEYRYDNFFNQLTQRPDGYSQEDLLGPKNAGRLIRAVTQDYCEYMRHVIDRNFRPDDASSRTSYLSVRGGSSASPKATVTGTFSADVTHLVIDGTSKLVLQILLAVMTGLSLVGFSLVKIRGTLPRDPCSIGSTMALLVDSQLCDRKSKVMPQDAEYMNENQLKEALDGWVFSLGWWHGDKSSGSTPLEEVYDLGSFANVSSDEISERQQHEKRFGIDIGRAGS